MARDIYFLENWDHASTLIVVPNGNLKLAQVSPYTLHHRLGLDAAGIIDLLQTYEKIPTFPVN
jgi:hypothetical protein